MTAHAALTGVVLAGGQSRRMGVDKAMLVVDGQRMVDRAVESLAEVCGQVVVAAGTRTIHGLSVAQIADAGVGPLGGIVAGLRAAPTALVAVVAVDMPTIDTALLLRLAQEWDGESAVVPVTGDRLQPLHAVYSTAAASDLEALLDAGDRSPTRALQRLGCRAVPVADAAFATNLNRPDDLPPAARPAAG